MKISRLFLTAFAVLILSACGNGNSDDALVQDSTGIDSNSNTREGTERSDTISTTDTTNNTNTTNTDPSGNRPN